MHNRRYQVYVCCSPEDLEGELRSLIFALLELDCIPACRLLLGASASWSDVRAEINRSDYVLVLSAALYGALLENGISSAHRDYTYACSRGKPVLSLISDTDLPRQPEQQERTAEGRARLLAFRRQLRRHRSLSWGSEATLLQRLRQTLPDFIRENSAPGWRRSTQAQTLAALTRTPPKLPEVEARPQPVRHEELDSTRLEALKQRLAQRQELAFRCNLFIEGNCHLVKQKVSLPLQELFLGCASALQAGPCSEDRVQLALASLLEHRYRRLILERHPQAHAVDEFSLLEDGRRLLRMQLRRLGLLRKVSPAAHRKTVIWSLTPQAYALLAELKENRPADG